MVAAVGFVEDFSLSVDGPAPRLPQSLKALRSARVAGRATSARRRAKAVRIQESVSGGARRDAKLRTAWAGDSSELRDRNEALWLADDFLFPADRHQLGEASSFPPQFDEAPPNRNFASHRASMARYERTKDEESRQLFAHVPAATADLSELPRRRRIQLLGGLRAAADKQSEALPRHRREAEAEPMRHVSAGRARCEFRARWGSEAPPHRHLRRGVAASEEETTAPEESSGDSSPSFELLDPGIAPREMFAEHEKSKPTAFGQTLLPCRQQREAEEAARESPPDCEGPYAEPSRAILCRQNQEEDLANPTETSREIALEAEPVTSRHTERLRGDSFASMLQELTSVAQEGEAPTASQCTRLARLGRHLEVQSYALRFDQLTQALVAVGRAAAKVEVAATPIVTDRLVLREHWRRKHQDLRTSANAMAEAVTGLALNAHLADVAQGLKALADSGMACQERLDAHLSRLKELFRQERVSACIVAQIAGALGQILLPGAHNKGQPRAHAREGATPQARLVNLRFIADFADVLGEVLCEFTELEFREMSWVFPTVYLHEGQLRQVLGRAAELQVGLRPVPDSAACRTAMRHVADFVHNKMPRLNAGLSEFVRQYCDTLRQ